MAEIAGLEIKSKSQLRPAIASADWDAGNTSFSDSRNFLTVLLVLVRQAFACPAELSKSETLAHCFAKHPLRTQEQGCLAHTALWTSLPGLNASLSTASRMHRHVQAQQKRLHSCIGIYLSSVEKVLWQAPSARFYSMLNCC